MVRRPLVSGSEPRLSRRSREDFRTNIKKAFFWTADATEGREVLEEIYNSENGKIEDLLSQFFALEIDATQLAYELQCLGESAAERLNVSERA
jgi:hypothetical protein